MGETAGEHISYDIMMFYETFIKIVWNKWVVEDDVCYWALFESFLTHARNLLEFFWAFPNKEWKDDKFAKEFISDSFKEKWIILVENLKKHELEKPNYNDKISKTLSHLVTLQNRNIYAWVLNNKTEINNIMWLLKAPILKFIEYHDKNKTWEEYEWRFKEYQAKLLNIVT